MTYIFKTHFTAQWNKLHPPDFKRPRHFILNEPWKNCIPFSFFYKNSRSGILKKGSHFSYKQKRLKKQQQQLNMLILTESILN